MFLEYETMAYVDRRAFKRYPKDSVIYLKCNNRSFEAKTVDYSLSGVGVVIKNPLRGGDAVNLLIKEPEINTTGEIVFVKDVGSGFRVGIKNSGHMKGLIKDFRFVDTFIGFKKTCKTGTLDAKVGNITKRIYIRDGNKIFSGSDDSKERLGEILLKQEKITLEQYNYSMEEMNRTKQRLGKVLVSAGYITPQELYNAVLKQVEERILSFFTFKDGTFFFNEGPLPTDEVIILKLSTANLIYYGIKNINDVDYIKSELPPMNSKVYFTSDPFYLYQDIKLDLSGKKVLSLLGNLSIKEIISASQLDTSESIKTIYALLSIRMIITEAGYMPLIKVPKTLVKEILEQKISHVVKHEVEEMYRQYKGLGYYGVLGVQSSASISEIKIAYYEVAKKFHPDVYFRLNDDSLKDKLNHIFSFIHEAYITLSDPKKREDYDGVKSIKSAKPSTNRDKAKEKFEQGKIQLTLKRFPDAELLFSKAIYFDKSRAEYHYYYGLAQFNQNKLKDAVKAFTTANELDPSHADYIAELGCVYLALGFPKRARGLFEKALKISPYNMRASKGIGEIKNIYDLN